MRSPQTTVLYCNAQEIYGEHRNAEEVVLPPHWPRTELKHGLRTELTTELRNLEKGGGEGVRDLLLMTPILLDESVTYVEQSRDRVEHGAEYLTHVTSGRCMFSCRTNRSLSFPRRVFLTDTSRENKLVPVTSRHDSSIAVIAEVEEGRKKLFQTIDSLRYRVERLMSCFPKYM